MPKRRQHLPQQIEVGGLVIDDQQLCRGRCYIDIDKDQIIFVNSSKYGR